MAKQIPKIYYGMHFEAGVAEYDQQEGEATRLFINEETIKKMNPSFSGRPVYVGHREVNLDNIQNEADGYVVESFFNKPDGKCWVKFVVVSDAGHEAIMKGYKLSNSYMVKNSGPAGKWHNVDYTSEVVDGEYNHLAIVEKPRYEESIILTPEQFKEYNLRKENELKVLQNSKQESKIMKFNFFKRAKVDNSEEIAKTVVILKNGEEKTVEDLINMAEEKEEKEPKNEEPKKEEPKNEEPKKEEEPKNEEEEEDKKMIKVGNEEVSLKDLKNCYLSQKKNAEEKAEKKEEEPKNEEPKKEEDKEKLNAIKNAINNVSEVRIIDTTINKIARGAKLYGSNK